MLHSPLSGGLPTFMILMSQTTKVVTNVPSSAITISQQASNSSSTQTHSPVSEATAPTSPPTTPPPPYTAAPTEQKEKATVTAFEKYCTDHDFHFDRPPVNCDHRSAGRRITRTQANDFRKRWYQLRGDAERDGYAAVQYKPKVGPVPKPSPNVVAVQQALLDEVAAERARVAAVAAKPPLPHDVKQALKDVDQAEEQKQANIKELTAEKKVLKPASKALAIIDRIKLVADAPLPVAESYLQAMGVLAKAPCSPPDVVMPVAFPDRQLGLRRRRIAGYDVVSTIVEAIAAPLMSGGAVYSDNAQSLARQYAIAELTRNLRPPGKESGSGGRSYDSFVDLGENHIEVYAVAALYRAIESDLIMWRASPKAAQATKTDWKKLSAIAGLCMVGGIVGKSLSASILSTLGIAGAVLFGVSTQTKLAETLHRALFPNDSVSVKMRRFFGLQKATPEGENETLVIPTNLTLTAEGYSSQKYSAYLPQHFPLSPPAAMPSSEYRQLHLDHVQGLLKSTTTTSSGGPASSARKLSAREKDLLCSGLSQRSHDIIQREETKTPLSVQLSRAFYSMENQWSSRRPISSRELLKPSTPMRALISSLDAKQLSRCDVRRGSLASQRAREQNSSNAMISSIGVMFLPTFPLRSSAKENESKSQADVVWPPKLNMSTTGTYVRRTTSSKSSSAQVWSRLQCASKKCGTAIRGFTSTCQAQTKNLATGIRTGLANLAKKTPPILIAQGWTQLKENLQCSLASQLCDRSAYLRRLSNGSDYSYDPAERLAEMESHSSVEQCCEPEFQTPRSPTQSSQRQPSAMAQSAVEGLEEKTSLTAAKATTASASTKSTCTTALSSPTSSSGSSSNASEVTLSTGMTSAQIDSIRSTSMEESCIGPGLL